MIIFVYLHIVIAVIGYFIIASSPESESLSKRDIIGSVVLTIGIALSLVHIGASERDLFFDECNGRYYYRFWNIFIHNDNENALSDTICQTQNDTASIQYMPYTVHNGIMYVDINVGNDTVQVIFDTGCNADMMLNCTVYDKFVNAGLINENDYVHTKFAEMSNGSICNVHIFKIDSIKIGNMTFNEVSCAVTEETDGSNVIGNSLFRNHDILINSKDKKIYVY